MPRPQNNMSSAPGVPAEMPSGTPQMVDHSFTLQAVMELQKQTGKFEHAIGDLTDKIDSQDIPALRERLAKIESRLEHTATSKDVATLEATIIKWIITTAFALCAVLLAAIKLLK